MVNITVDGKVIDAPAGAPLVEVLKRNGVYVSNLCYIDGLKPYAGCRTCLVDIEGPPGLQLSCTATVQENMIVRVDTEEVRDARKAVLSLILANHSDRCLTCHRREHCHPGDICLRDDVVTHRCLTCSKNYRCELQATCEMAGMSGYEPWVGEERSFYQAPQPPADRANPFMEFDPQMCIICTRCQRACEDKRHTGAITLSGKGWDTRIAFGAGGPIHDSNCDFSGACIDVCPTAALMEHPNKWVAKPDTWTTTTCDSCAVGCSLKLGAKDGRGVIVRPGAGNPFSGDQICVRGRYHYDSLKPRERLGRHLLRRGAIQAPVTFNEAVADAASSLKAAGGKVGVLVGGTATVEEGWAAAQIAKALGGSADLGNGPVVRAIRDALTARLGTWQMATDLTQLPRAKAVVVIADDLEESHNVSSVRIKDAVRRNGAALVVIGALRSELVDFARVWLRPAPGEEGQMAAALARAVAGEAATGEIAAAAALLKDSPGDDTFVVCAPNPVAPTQAATMAGGAANLAIAIAGEAATTRLAVFPPEANTWGLLRAGVGAIGTDNPLADLSALLVVREDPTMHLPSASQQLTGLSTVVAIDNVLSDTAKRANVVIAEGRAYASDGTYVQAGFRAMKLARAVRPEGEAVTLYEALRALGQTLGVAIPDDPVLALAAMAREDGGWAPAADLILGEGVQLEVPATPGSVTAVPVEPARPQGGDVRLITGRDLYTAADAAAVRHREADKLHRYDHIQVSEGDAARLGINDGDTVTLSAGNATLTAPASVTDRVPDGGVYVSSLLQGGAVVAFYASSAHPAARLSVSAVRAQQRIAAH